MNQAHSKRLRRRLCLTLYCLVALTVLPIYAQTFTIAAAGDIACSPSDESFNEGQGTANHCAMQATSELILRQHVDAVLALGDLQYSKGRLNAFKESFAPSWGRFLTMIYPIPGNHEYWTADAADYYAYFGARAGDPAQGYYSFDLGNWHLIALNSDCEFIGGCGPGSAQLDWLDSDLTASSASCTLAYWHHPRFSSGQHGSDPQTEALWQRLQQAGAELVLSGHDHAYERFAPQTANGEVDTAGLRQFVVGTGGFGFYHSDGLASNSEVMIEDVFGVLFLTLEPNSYSWSFESITGEVLDTGSAACQ